MRVRVVWLGFLAGCGGRFDSGLPGGRLVTDLDDAQVCELLDGYADYGLRRVDLRVACTLNAQLEATFAVSTDPVEDFRSVCEASRDACLATGDHLALVTWDDRTCDAGRDRPGPDCTATVRDYEACFTSLIDEVVDRSKNGCRPVEVAPEADDGACDLVFGAACSG